MSFEDLIESVVRKVVREELRGAGGASSSAKALTRRQAERAMGVGRTKLQELIAQGEIKTVRDNPRLVPATEIERYCEPRRQKPRRRAAPHAPQQGTQNVDTLRETLRRGG